MRKQSNSSPTAAERRNHAEERLRERRPENESARTEADAQHLLHKLQVHQIELEMQNAELQRARDSLEAALEKYSDLYDFAPVCYLTLDREGTILETNLATANLLGIERSRLLKLRLRLFISEDDRPAFNSFLTRVFVSNMRESCEVTLLKEGKPTIVMLIEGVMTESGQECRTVAADITERKRAAEDRLVMSKLESTGILAGGIAHDFNNLLTVILLDIELAQHLIPPGEEPGNLLKRAKQAGETSKRLAQRLLALAEGGAPVRKPTYLAELIREASLLAVSGSPTRCDFSLAEDLWLMEVDSGQIEQVIVNLVLNAQEAMPQGGIVSIQAKNVVLGPRDNSMLPPGDYVLVSIEDQGAGISKEARTKIFDPYFSTKQRGNQKGMGLGLTICYTVIRNHGGAIAVESEPGVGTTFHFHLPASRNLHEKEKASVPANLPGHGRILVMDDEEDVRNLIEMSLEQMGHEVELVADGQRAIEVYGSAKNQGRPFDAVILDLTIRAGVGGQEAIQALLQIDPAVKAIVMSGYSGDSVMTEPERYGFRGVLAKPFDIAKLQETLSRVMGPVTGSRQ